MPRRTGFTLMEMLVVISIITLLISITVPNLRAAKEHARGIKCRKQLRQIGLATIAFCDDHKQRLPGIWGAQWVNPAVSGGGCWLSNPVSPQSSWEAAPETGELWTYYGREPEVLRCPTLSTGVLNSGVGSNGKFDYSAFHAFAGATFTKVPLDCEVTVYKNKVMPTPWIIEEAPDQWLNNGHVEGGFGGSDVIGNWHNGGGNMVALDGSAHNIANTRDLSTWSFYTYTPSGQLTSLASHPSGFGGWDNR